ncbi:hypothetical protein BDZ89DRAFT_1144615 [Hymenopellis radicata]|nr:hypothetical protein BDZ89DRAFT_1144615 [Hymenopellis radicata]
MSSGATASQSSAATGDPEGRGRKRRNFGQVEYVAPTASQTVNHSLFYDASGLAESQPIQATPLSIAPSDLDDPYSSLDFVLGDADGDLVRHHHLGGANVCLDPNGEPVTFLERDRMREQAGAAEESGSHVDVEPDASTGKRKRFPSDDPMGQWHQWLDVFLEETLRKHGLGDATLQPRCSSCQIDLDVSEERDPEPMEGQPRVSRERPYRCRSCGDFVECKRCCLTRHERSPLHVIKVWREGTWERTTLRELGLVYQIGHGGAPCPYPDQTPRLMTVLHVTGVHVVAFRYCGCSAADTIHHIQQLLRTSWYPATTQRPSTCMTMEVLELYRRLKVIATVNVRDFVTTLESATDPYETEWTPDRYKGFALASRQYTFLMRARRSGVVHDGGLELAAPGALIVECWACPRPGVNLPKDWENVAEKYQYRFRRIVSMDANFRMSSKLKVEAQPDLPLYDGLGVQMPMEQYAEWLRSYVTEEEVSNCATFAALMQKDTWFTVGLRWSGVIGVICARHEIMLGLGDLQKGERYKNTDFVLYTVLARMGLKEVAVTYDIACQYKKNFFARIEALPDRLRALDIPALSWGLPVWHGNVHDPYCEAAESLKYMVGAGKTDGEGPERKNIRLGYTLFRRLKLALQERTIQVEAFRAVARGVTEEQSSAWSKIVLDWLADPKKKNPYIAPKGQAGPTEAEVRRDLRKQEEQEAAADKSPPEEEEAAEERVSAAARGGRTGTNKRKKKRSNAATMSETGFLMLGARLEASQHRLREEKTGTLTVDRQTKIHEHRHAATLKMKEFRKWQSKFMPAVAAILEEEEEERRESNCPFPPVEDVELYMPSTFGSLKEEDRKRVCSLRLFEKEAALRRGQCGDALQSLRRALLSHRHFVNYRNANVTGQSATTRAATLIRTLSARVKLTARRYRFSRSALEAIVGAEGCGGFLELLEEDVEVMDVEESDADAVRELASLNGRPSRVTAKGSKGKEKEKHKKKRRDAPGETRRLMSWIWTANGGPGEDDEEYVHESVRIDWSKALARKTRWGEEVETLKEEMRRVLRTLTWEEALWRRRAAADTSHLKMEERGGRRAYALQQAKDRARIREEFVALWKREAPARGQPAGPMDAAAHMALTRLINEEDGGDVAGVVVTEMFA